jgi:hypothetical protein
MSTQLAIANFAIDHRVSARDLQRFVALIHDVYSWHVLIDHMDIEHVDNPTYFLPSSDEELLINRLEIGTPNFIELIGLVQPMIDSLAWLASISGSALTTIKIIKGFYEIREKRAAAIKLERELSNAKTEGRLIEREAQSIVRQPDLLIRTRIHAQHFSKEELHAKEEYLLYGKNLVLELVPKFASKPTIVVFDRGD